MKDEKGRVPFDSSFIHHPFLFILPPTSFKPNDRARSGSVCVCDTCMRNATHFPAVPVACLCMQNSQAQCNLFFGNPLGKRVCAKLASAMQPIFVPAVLANRARPINH